MRNVLASTGIIEPATLPAELVEQVARGNCVLLLGPDASAPGQLETFTQALASECDYPAEKTDRSLPVVALYYQSLLGGRSVGHQRLITQLREWLEAQKPTLLHHAIARLPVDRIVDFGYDGRLEAALQSAGRPYTRVIYDHDLPYAGRDKLLLLKPWGAVDDPASLVLTADEVTHFLADLDPSRPLLINQLRVWVATKRLLWLGIDPGSPPWKRLYALLTAEIDPRHRRAYALPNSPAAAAAWTARGVPTLASGDLPAWLEQLTHAVAILPSPPRDTVPPPGPLLGRRPYKFLDYYTAADADLFFGRETWIERLGGLILAEPLVVLWGRSGVGKTSLLRAGVTPWLERHGCRPIYVHPGEDPLAAVQSALVALWETAEETTLAGNAELVSLVQKTAAHRSRTPVIILDQVEACFTDVAQPLRERWARALAHVLYEDPGTARWVLALREDFVPELHEWEMLLPSLFDHPTRLTPLDPDEARSAIVRPLERVQATIEDALIERLLYDLTGEGIAPEQLQIVCDRLYQARDETGQMTLARYEALGGARRILAEYIDVALVELPRERRELAVAVLKTLVTGQGAKLPRRVEDVLRDVSGDETEKQTVLARLVDTRLVRSLELGGERRYELAHEVLVTKVQGWIDETERQARQSRDLLRQERAAWGRLQVLPGRAKLDYLHHQRENPYLCLDEQDIELVVRAALHEQRNAPYWVGRAAAAGIEVWPLLAPLLESDQEQQRICAQWALSNWPAPQALDILRRGTADPSPRVRGAAHQSLYQIGTPESLAILNTSSDLRLVPAGSFSMGSKKDKPIHEMSLESFFIEKYLVTNEQYARFIAAGGYQDRQYWTWGGWHWVQRVQRAEPAFWQNDKWNRPEYPVVGVTWFEAWAYAQWAGRRLLTEAEWEKAASWEKPKEKGGVGVKRIYPWGNEFDRGRCNSSSVPIFWQMLFERGGTTPVGRYSPDGDSPYGVADMAGNIWEWTSSQYRPYPYQRDDGREDPDATGLRILRGGSWFDHQECCTCVSRGNNSPDVRTRHNGVRCGVAATHSPSL